jgi:hypothetical protein
MEYRPVASLKETIVAGAEFETHSSLRFMNLVQQKEEAEKRLQDSREEAFLNSDYVSDITFEDINTKDLSLTEGQLSEISALNLGEWRTTIEDCYQFRQKRDPESPLDRSQSVSVNFDLPSVDTSSLTFSTENVRLTSIDQKEAIEIHIDSENSLILYINTDNMEFYQGMYDPPVTQDINTLEGNIEIFDNLTIRNNSRTGKEIMESFKPDTVGRELESTEIIFGRAFDSLTYLPKSECMDSEENSNLQKDIEKLDNISSTLPDSNTKFEILKTLEKGYITSEVALKIFILINESKRVCVPYSYLISPRYVEQIARLTDTNLVSIPQDKKIVFTEEEPPEWIENFNRSFPQKNDLSLEEESDIESYLDTPEFIDLNNDWLQEIKSKEILLKLFEDNKIDQEDIVSYYFVPWDSIKPKQESVKKAIRYGDKLRGDVQKTDDKYGTDLYSATVIWEKRKIYKRGNFPTD